MNSLAEQKKIRQLTDYISHTLPRPCTIMEVCGTHTMSIARWGIRSLLPPELRLISGPGCPVCVTDTATIAEALALASMPGVIFTCFGDMLRVPAGDQSLAQLRTEGHDIRIVLSPLDALELAVDNPGRQVVFFAVGFETTAPLTAAVAESARMRGVTNFTMLTAHKTMPAAIAALLPGSAVDALLCPGHVAAVTGSEAFAFIPRGLGKPAVVSGFEPLDILVAIAYLVRDLASNKATLTNCYPRVVGGAGNTTALNMLQKVFRPCAAVWRGLGKIADSGLYLRSAYADFDARQRFQIFAADLTDNPACRCGKVLRGEIAPYDCPLFGGACTPERPAGACMVSSEGSCAAAYQYGRSNPYA
ncbi:MAG: hydrogenase formation protein HypD [Clostridia bacterium]|nr:hydrogenase formation protein HypD [Clostridia bacterium]